jgi:hypothetical protein
MSATPCRVPAHPYHCFMADFLVTYDLRDADSATYKKAENILLNLGFKGIGLNLAGDHRLQYPNTTYVGDIGTAYTARSLQDAIWLRFIAAGITTTKLLVAQVEDYSYRDVEPVPVR